MPLAQRQCDGLRAVPGLGDHLDVRLGVEDHPHAVADDGMVVGEQHTRANRGHGLHRGTLETDLRAAALDAALDAQVGTDRAARVHAFRGSRSPAGHRARSRARRR